MNPLFTLQCVTMTCLYCSSDDVSMHFGFFFLVFINSQHNNRMSIQDTSDSCQSYLNPEPKVSRLVYTGVKTKYVDQY